ncbi:asparagine synthase (glutamine-hydrolyzing) [Reichenbachiella versicolor]|uniref:asparagine synthase (glutamine-hydrolyzing) n=1 Tax=Reichenbachiella versicolor TaxID=1821036 RepID=UPI000D6E147E|nr:asparagine synthase (glutamine-hydrolyzing) [Reichenbachiella versicolor]
MCGITGIWAFNEIGRFQLTNLDQATRSLEHRGPDNHGTFHDHFVGLGHRRLSIIDTSSAGHQPFSIMDGRYQMVFNGEIYNYRELRKDLEAKGISFSSDSDTEVLINLFIHEGKSCLGKLNGFFAFAVYDTIEKSLFIARDRVGIKPMLYYQDEFKFLFASEIQSIIAYGIEPKVDQNVLHTYLQLNYTPAPYSMLAGVKKLMPGEYAEISDNGVKIQKYYELPTSLGSYQGSYVESKKELKRRLELSVQRRMVADVPLGTFLSGGIDSSVITAVASKQTDQLATFSIGFSDNKFFDETHYAESVARKFNTNHTTFKLSNDQIFSHISDIVDHLDEPFADSSAIPVYILCQETRKHVTVALSGDGADEIFSGYNKHAGWWKMENDSKFKAMVSLMAPFAKLIPQSRSGKFSNIARQILKFSKAMKMSHAERYWFLATLSSSAEASALLKDKVESLDSQQWLTDFTSYQDMNDMLRADSHLVLTNDMLKKVDIMSMANSLEVRVPFLDHELVEFVFSLPQEMKINGSMRKRILQDTYRDLLPTELYKRPKKGFEMPLLDWLKTSLASDLNSSIFNRDKIEDQSVFNWEEISALKQKLYSNNPGDVHAKVWAVYAFQKWYDKYF